MQSNPVHRYCFLFFDFCIHHIPHTTHHPTPSYSIYHLYVWSVNASLIQFIQQRAAVILTTISSVLYDWRYLFSSPIMVCCPSHQWIIDSTNAQGLTNLPLDKMASTFTDDILKCFSWMKILEFLFNFHWSLLLRVKLTISQYWFR